MNKVIILTAILLLSSCNVNTNPNSQIIIKPNKINTDLFHVQFYCGDSIYTFRNILSTDIDEYTISSSSGCPIYADGYNHYRKVFSINYNGRLYKSDKIHIFYD